MRDFLADLARTLALFEQRRADRIVASAKHKAGKANARAEFWSDVQVWLDGLAPWPVLRTQRRRRLRPLARTIMTGPAR